MSSFFTTLPVTAPAAAPLLVAPLSVAPLLVASRFVAPLGALLMAFGGALHAQSTWLTMVGNASEPFTNSIDVDAMSLTLVDSSRTLNIRVNRANPAVSSEGIPFRSYTATILVDCVGNTARFTSAAFHMMPNWDGKPHKTMTWTAAEIRPVLFRNFDPNPKEKIIRAACRGFAR